ncbi:MAG: DUF6171 family protein [Butyrivibrio sp.]|nr:DUF6171 family protein [Butyrivibrio sp.]
MDNNGNKCRICLIRDMAGKEDILSYINKTRDMLTDEDRVSNLVYEERLKKCTSCDNLLSATCMKCGCYVEIRALAQNNHCPLKKRKW